MRKELPKRKPTRLKDFDYSSTGAYFVTICIQNRKPLLSHIVKSVGVGALDDPQVQVTRIGKIIEKNLLSSENIPGVTIDRYVIMPDHIHAILVFNREEYIKRQNGSSRAPTPTNEMLPHIVSTFKRFCNKEIGEDIFQRGYSEHIIRDREDYETRIKYIQENPMRWYYKQLEKKRGSL